MKNVFKTLMLSIVIGSSVFAQDPPPPPPGGGHGGGGALPPGGGATIGEGIFILMALGAAWSGKKVYDARKRLAE